MKTIARPYPIPPRAQGPSTFGARPPSKLPPGGRSGLAQTLPTAPPVDIALDLGAVTQVEIGADSMADAEAALGAMQSFRSAEAALQRNDLVGAQQLAQQAVHGDPTQGDYVSLLAWIKSLSGSASVGEAIMTMSSVLHDEPSNERALLYRGKLLARSNRLQEAILDFTELIAGNPQHREAQSELRAAKAKLG
jgi:tetratricopeptide (TPR) repeat protein